MPDDAYNFPLAWRWTRPSHNVLPPEVMARIAPVRGVILPAGVTAGGGLDRLAFEGIEVASAGVSCEEGAEWLGRLGVAAGERVVVRWEGEVAAETEWEVFVRYWDDFCYAGSDDVVVFPESGAWVLLYHHWEAFEWGRRRANQNVRG